MALKQSKLQQIPQRNKDLTFGYSRECGISNKKTIPDMIKYLCLIYLNETYETIDANYTHRNININGNVITCNSHTAINCYLENIVNKLAHIWTFKCHQRSSLDLIGIRKCKDITPRLNGYFDGLTFGTAQSIKGRCGGYGFKVDGLLTNPDNPRQWGGYCQYKCINGDIIAMKLDFNDLSLSFKINDGNFDKAFDIQYNDYRAVITMTSQHSCYELISYHKVY